MKILLVQTGFLGDTILSTPVIAAIKSVHPQAGLWMMTTPQAAGLVRGDPRLSGVIGYDKRGRDAGLTGLLAMARRLAALGFDRAYSLHRSYRTGLMLWMSGIPLRIGCDDARLPFAYHETRPRELRGHAVMRNLAILGPEMAPDSADVRMRLFPPERDALSLPLRRELPPPEAPYAILVPGSVWATKMWHADGYRSVARFLLAKNVRVVLLGASADRPVCDRVAGGLDVVDLAGKTRISEAMAVMNDARLVVCNDSMALHMASALQIPTVAVFCATSPAFGYGPWQNRAIVVEKQDLDCRPCRPHGSRTCPTGTQACMTALSADRVIAAVRELMDMP